MSKISRLINSYGKYIAVPWREDAAAQQRVVFCVYHPSDERSLRTKLDEFKLVTQQAGHEWALFDLTNTFATWLASQKYAKRYFEEPERLAILHPKYLEFIVETFKALLASTPPNPNTVVAVHGVASLFGFIKVKEVVDKLSPMVPGRLLVFFPGSYENNNYRLLDGYDGWDYLAVPITEDSAH